MIQRVQTLWMLLTAALVCVVLLMPAVYFSLGGTEFKLMCYGIKGITGQMLVHGGEPVRDGVITSMLSVCVTIVTGAAALLPLVTVFLYNKRKVQIRLLIVEFVFLLGSAGFLAYYVVTTYRNVVAGMSTNFFFSFFPLLTVIAMLTNWFALRGVTRDEILVRSVDRIR